MKDKVLLQTANALVASVQKLSSPGLLEGKMGVAFFLYHYARYSGHTVYSDFASHLIYDILEKISGQKLSFSNGLSGVTWAINYLLKEHYIFSDDDILEDFDHYFVRCIKEQSNKDMLDSSIYLACCRPKLLDEAMASVLERQINVLLSSGHHPLPVLNKVLALVRRMPQICNKRLPDALIQAIDAGLFRYADIVICRDLLDAFNNISDNKAWNMLCDRCSSILNKRNTVTDCIETVWQYAVFLDNAINADCDTGYISQKVAETVNDIKTEHLYLTTGLPAMGMAILLTSKSDDGTSQ